MSDLMSTSTDEEEDEEGEYEDVEGRHVLAWVVALLVLVVLLAIGGGIAAGYALRKPTSSHAEIDSLRRVIDDDQSNMATMKLRIDGLQKQVDHLTKKVNTTTTTFPVPPPEPVTEPPPMTFATGVYQVGVDIPPGEYRTTSPSCIWMKLRTPARDQASLIALGGGGQTVNVDSPYFRSENCVFTKVG